MNPELRMLTVEAVALELVERHGSCAPADQDECQAALWLWIANESRAAREALRELSNLVCEAAEKSRTEPEKPSA